MRTPAPHIIPDKIIEWINRHISGSSMILISSVIIGIMAGTAAFMLKSSIRFISTSLTSTLNPDSPNIPLLLFPVAGILLTGIFSRYIMHRHLEHGVEQMQQAILSRRYRLSPRLLYAPMIASSFTLGFGGSAGSEGPIAYTGGAIGSNIARVLRMPSENVLLLMACGAGAGIAGIFKAPVGGALFTFEVLGIAMTATGIIAAITASLSAGLTAYALSGCTLDLNIHILPSFDPSHTPAILLLGIFCGIYSWYYTCTMKHVRHHLEAISNPWTANIVSGCALAILIFLFPSLYGEGYDAIARIADGSTGPLTAYSPFASIDTRWALPVITAGILLCKGAAASLSNSGGGVAGDFAPTLFAGCLAGFLFATTGNTILGTHLPVGEFAIIGMAGVMSGVIGAPLMAMFLTVEMTGTPHLLLPVTVVSVLSRIITKAIGRRSAR